MIRVEHTLNASARTIRALVAAGMLVALMASFLIVPENSPFPSCEFHALTGLSCFTCGLTRSLHALSHGELIGAFGYHLMGPVIVLCMMFMAGVLSFEAMSGRRLHAEVEKKHRTVATSIFVASWLVYWGIRLISELTT
jgi:hypothetical protein